MSKWLLANYVNSDHARTGQDEMFKACQQHCELEGLEPPSMPTFVRIVAQTFPSSALISKGEVSQPPKKKKKKKKERKRERKEERKKKAGRMKGFAVVPC